MKWTPGTIIVLVFVIGDFSLYAIQGEAYEGNFGMGFVVAACYGIYRVIKG